MVTVRKFNDLTRVKGFSRSGKEEEGLQGRKRKTKIRPRRTTTKKEKGLSHPRRLVGCRRSEVNESQ